MLPTINFCFHYINLKVPWLNNLPFYLSIDYTPSFLLITYLGKNQEIHFNKTIKECR